MRWVGGILLIVGISIPLCSMAGSDVQLPESVCGRWETDKKGYENNYLVLTNEEICFGTGAPGLSAFPIVEIESKELGAQVQYVITYRDAGGLESVFTFDHMVTRSTIRLIRRPSVHWKRVEAAGPR